MTSLFAFTNIQRNPRTFQKNTANHIFRDLLRIEATDDGSLNGWSVCVYQLDNHDNLADVNCDATWSFFFGKSPVYIIMSCCILGQKHMRAVEIMPAGFSGDNRPRIKEESESLQVSDVNVGACMKEMQPLSFVTAPLLFPQLVMYFTVLLSVFFFFFCCAVALHFPTSCLCATV